MKKVVVTIIFFSSLLFIIGLVNAQVAPVTYYGCYTKNGTFRIVSGPGQCKSNETGISWNNIGPQGEQGIQGEKGIQGIQGLQGQKGDQGDPGVSPNQECPTGSQMIGIDEEGKIICNTKVVFVSSVPYTGGSLGGISGADAKCQELATAAGLSGTFKAWLSDSTHSPSTTFTRSPTPYVLVDGTVIASNWGDLTDGTINHAIDLTETGGFGTWNGYYAWTGTAEDGTASTQSCSSSPDCFCGNWQSIAGNGIVGYIPGTAHDYYSGGHGWSEATYGSCISIYNNGHPIYCFQQ